MQDGPGASDELARLTDDEPAAAVAVPVHVLLNAGGVATTRPDGRLSVNVIAFSVRFWLLLEIVNVRLVVPFSGMVAAPNALAMLGGLMTVRLAEEVDSAPVPAAVELMVTELL